MPSFHNNPLSLEIPRGLLCEVFSQLQIDLTFRLQSITPNAEGVDHIRFFTRPKDPPHPLFGVWTCWIDNLTYLFRPDCPSRSDLSAPYLDPFTDDHLRAAIDFIRTALNDGWRVVKYTNDQVPVFQIINGNLSICGLMIEAHPNSASIS